MKNGLLGKACGSNEEKLVGNWRKLRNVELRYLKSLSDFSTMTKSRKLRWVEHVARRGKVINHRLGRNNQCSVLNAHLCYLLILTNYFFCSK